MRPPHVLLSFLQFYSFQFNYLKQKQITNGEMDTAPNEFIPSIHNTKVFAYFVAHTFVKRMI